MTIDPNNIGKRMVVRYVVAGFGPSGGPAMTDVVGRVLALDARHVTVEKRDGSTVDVDLAAVVAAKIVPPSPVRSRRAQAISAENLTRITSRGWPAAVSEALGEWELRAASGFTGRANSVAVHGDPGMPFAEAIARVVSFYADQQLPPLAQVIVGSAGEKLFRDAGWSPVEGRPGGAIVQVAELADSAEIEPGSVGDAVVDVHVTDEWLTRYRRVDEDPIAARAVLEGPATVGFLSIANPITGSPIVAIGRVVVTGEWAGLSCVEVAPEARRQGLATRIVEASIIWARGNGADKAYLQTMTDNDAAIALYAPYGFRTHHAYLYLTPAFI
ncbi:MAG: GNAT family N-acetyltransferase [Kineosporiaceae bacterium]|nr:GNAT family N-acetyltransferase [Aeromicrobium sp.]